MLLEINRLLGELETRRIGGVAAAERRSLAERAVQLATPLRQRLIRAAALVELADCRLGEDTAQALALIRDAKLLFDAETAPNLAALALTVEAEALLAGDAEAALARATEAISHAELQLNGIADPLLRATVMRGKIRAYAAAVRAALGGGQLPAALAVAERSRPSLPGTPPFALDAVRAGLAPGEAVLAYFWTASDRLLVVVLTRLGADHKEMAASPAAVALLDRLSDNLRGKFDETEAGAAGAPVGVGGWSFDGADVAALDDLAELLLPGWARRVLEGAGKLLILPHLVLHAVPFGLLPFRGGRLGLQLPWAEIPSLSVLLRPVPVAAERGLAAIGIDRYPAALETPGFGAAAARIAEDHAARGRPSLLVEDPGAYGKLRALAAGRQLEKTGFLMLACHGTSVQADEPDQSFLQIGADRLTAGTITTMRLPCDLVLLAACCSGQRGVGGLGIHAWPGDDLFGLQSAFARAGARQLIGSLWNVDVSAACRLIPLVHEAWSHGADAAECLHHAVNDLDTDVFHNLNFDWAPFCAFQFGRSASGAPPS